MITKHVSRTVLAAVVALLSLGQLAAQAQKPWIHIHVTEQGEEAKKVQVNLPLSVVETAMDLVPRNIIEKGHLKLQNSDISVADLRKLWQELRVSGDAEFVSVEQEGQTVRIARQGDKIQINIDKTSSNEPKVRIEVPVSVVDALLEGEGPELNLRAAVSQLRGQRGELVKVQDGNTQVRIWIDERS